MSSNSLKTEDTSPPHPFPSLICILAVSTTFVILPSASELFQARITHAPTLCIATASLHNPPCFTSFFFCVHKTRVWFSRWLSIAIGMLSSHRVLSFRQLCSEFLGGKCWGPYPRSPAFSATSSPPRLNALWFVFRFLATAPACSSASADLLVHVIDLCLHHQELRTAVG